MALSFNDKLLKLITSRCASNQAAHFYQIKLLAAQEEESFISQWLAPLASSLFFEESLNDLNRVINHPDFYILGRKFEDSRLVSSKKTDYNLDDISEFTKFANTPPWQGKLRLSVVFDTHRLNALVSNKLLKTLEEPAQGNIILFVNSLNQEILKTIESRSVNIRLSSFTQESEKEASDFAGKSLSALMNLDKSGDHYLRHILNNNSDKPSYASCHKALELTKWTKQSKEYNNPYQERLSRLYLFDKSF